MEKLEKRDLKRESVLLHMSPDLVSRDEKTYTIRFYNMAIYKTFTIDIAISV